MIIRRYDRKGNTKIIIKRRGITMAVLAKPINRAFIIAEDKSEKFKNEKRSSKLDEILRKAKMINIKK